MAPFAAFLILALFGMDERLSSAHPRSVARRKFCEVGPDGKGRLSDPDGRCGDRPPEFHRFKAGALGNSPTQRSPSTAEGAKFAPQITLS
jgi:hypothetical protein